MKLLLIVVTSLLLLLQSSRASLWSYWFPPKLRIGAFNIQAYGQTKAENPLILRILATVICKYDLLAVQELKDTHHIAIDRLHMAVNRKCPTFGVRVSPRSGDEQIALFYRMRRVVPLDSALSASGKFARAPFTALFQSTRRKSFRFVVVVAHLKPTAAVAELNALPAVYAAALNKWREFGIQSAVMMGDFNADCSYVPNNQWSNIKLRTNPKFNWLIPTGQQTAVTTNCTYDRIIVEDQFLPSVVSAGVDYYHRMLSVRLRLFFSGRGTGIRDISDHFPVSVVLTTRPRGKYAKKQATIAQPDSKSTMQNKKPGTSRRRNEPSESTKNTPPGTKVRRRQVTKRRSDDEDYLLDSSDDESGYGSE